MTLLDYSLATAPSPIQTSSVSPGVAGRLNIAVSDPGATVWCDAIAVKLTIGSGASDWGADTPDASVSTNAWTIADVSDPSNPLAVFTFLTASGKAEQLGPGLALSLAGALNGMPGLLAVAISEHSGTDPNNLAWSAAVTFLVDKTTPQFYVQNLVALVPDAPTQPVTEFAAGAPIRLEWESNGSWFEVYAKGTSTPVYAGSATSCTLSQGAGTDTTFLLVASSSPAGGIPTPGYQPVSLYDAITVTVSDPILTPSSVAASGPVSATSLASAGEISGVTIGATGTVSGKQLAATDTVTANTASVAGNVAAHNVAASAAVLSGTATVATAASVGQTLSTQSLRIGSWTFTTDASGNLLIVSDGSTPVSLQLSPAGVLDVNGHRAIVDSDPVNIYSNSRRGFLNATSKGSPNLPSSFQGWTYWQGGGDGDSDLQLRYGNPW